MTRNSALALSAAFTAFVLVVAAGLVANLSVARPAPAPAEQASAPAPAAEPRAPAVAPEAAARADTRTQPPAQDARLMTTARLAISPAEAGEIAARALGGGRVRSVELERERGTTVYEVKVGSAEVYVDAYSGQVLASERERDDDD